jgi:hypothetical protein
LAVAHKKTKPLSRLSALTLALSGHHEVVGERGLRIAAAAIAAFVVTACSLSAAAAETPSDPRGMFRALGVGDEYFDRFTDSGPLGAAETDSLLRIMFRLRVFPGRELRLWALGPAHLVGTAQQPSEYRSLVFRLGGRVTSVEPVRPPAADAERFEMARYFRCLLEPDDPAVPLAEIYTEQVPAAWAKGAKPNARGGALGVLLKRVADGQRPTIAFAAPRLAWFPDDPLGRLGMDVGLLDAVKDQERIDADREAFYELLAAAGRARPGQLLREADAALPTLPDESRRADPRGNQFYSVVPLFNAPASQRGRLVALCGVARRIERVLVDPADAARWGFDHYWQVSLFTDDSQGNPLTFCVRELPPNIQPGSSPDYAVPVRAAGFFFKTWPYAVSTAADAVQPDDGRKTRVQLSPLLIGRSLELVNEPTPRGESTASNLFVAVVIALATALIWLFARRSARRKISPSDNPSFPQ